MNTKKEAIMRLAADYHSLLMITKPTLIDDLQADLIKKLNEEGITVKQFKEFYNTHYVN